jgi:RimJ/RimL family protein N-acetyltransferase
MNISVRGANKNDFENLVDYFLNADQNFLLGMGVDASKLPQKEAWIKLLEDDYGQPVENKKFYYVIWLVDNLPVGHSNINKIIFGQEAYLHLHMWARPARQKGLGEQFIRKSIPIYFENFKLQNLFCEPYALNTAPNRVLKKVGFDFVKNYQTTPGWLNFHQPVNRWLLDVTKFKSLF